MLENLDSASTFSDEVKLALKEKIVAKLTDTDPIDESEKDKKYDAFVAKKLKAAGFDSIGDMNDEETKKFFNMIDKEYNTEDEPGKDT